MKRSSKSNFKSGLNKSAVDKSRSDFGAQVSSSGAYTLTTPVPSINLFIATQTRARRRDLIEKIFAGTLLFPAIFSVFITLAIVGVLFWESLSFFSEVSVWEFLTGREWTPLFEQAKYGILPLLSGTLLTSAVALTVAIPIGTFLALFLSEFVPAKFRDPLKTILELLSAVPTVVFGYFALLFVTPILQKIFPGLPGFNALSAGLVMGVMILPYVCSLSEDALRAVPMELREGAYALGSSKWEVAFKVVLPAANSGVIAAFTLAIARAVGETMIVAVAAGMQPNLTMNPAEPAQTITAYIVQVSLGDLPHGSLAYQTIFAAGLVLFVFTFVLNCVGSVARARLSKNS